MSGREKRAEGTRARIVRSAFRLFVVRGYEGTTIDAIAEDAEISRRTFFRYFPAKEDVIFADHDRLLKQVDEFLASAPHPVSVATICGAVQLVFRGYVHEPDVSVARYRLTRSVPALRQRELASVARYERTFSRYLQQPGAPAGVLGDVGLSADVTAAAVVATHNHVLRHWLRDGGRQSAADAEIDLETALKELQARLEADQR